MSDIYREDPIHYAEMQALTNYFSTESQTARDAIAKELVEDGKTTVRYAMQSLNQIELDLRSTVDNERKVIWMLNDLGRQIEMLTAMHNKIKRHIVAGPAPMPTPTPAPYSVLESSPT